MDPNYWLQRWKQNEIGFHESEANPLLVKHFKALSLAKNSRIFVPLCGKTLDIGWLLTNGYRIAGAELSEQAIAELFMELAVEPKISVIGEIKHYSAKNLDIFVGDIFNISIEMLGSINAVYDRAALVALPKEMRKQYTAHLLRITNKAPQLLISFEYDQKLMEGPPFSVSNKEVSQHYGGSYDLTLIESADIPGGLKGIYAVKANARLLKNDKK
ncbi:thiopurine S-methyltransferase [Spartinivicinus poritis]|uniref:Thiopurine S-methyltransferase n=1 Tax=Spartinivicinus poritis TaxID=2994640 RepID=A0ABT5U7T6_9GAMM|nr:thiopurine S-methyltransferase [Spartinivicinus sp. A2-2]MDE1462439.1 thiopurine S-methyltransferase [Spartinivicinus sp. A2-2]